MASLRQRRSSIRTSISFPDQPSPFQIDQSELTRLVNEKDFGGLRGKHGGPMGIARALKTDFYCGISGEPDDVIRRQNAFGGNTSKRPAKGFFHFLLEAFKDLTHLILLVCAGLSPGLAIKESGLREGWYSGGSSFFSVFLVIVVSAVCKYQQNRQFDKLYGASGNILYTVMRMGQQQQVSRSNIVVGDLLLLRPGNQVPADGLYLYGHYLQVDESSMTGESNCMEEKHDRNPFLFSGTKVVAGDAPMLVTAVGMNTKEGKMMSSINRGSSEETPLQEWLNKLTSSISKVSLVVNCVVLVVLQILYFTGKKQGANGKQEFDPSQTMGDNIMNSVGGKIAATVTIVSVMIPEGLPIAVTLILAYSMKGMRDWAVVRKLWACGTMGSATTICIDKTGTLTTNQMKVTKFWVGQGFAAKNGCSSASKFVLDLIRDGVALNTHGRIYNVEPSSESVYGGPHSPTEKAILSWAVSQLNMDMQEIKESCQVIARRVLDKRNSSCVLIKKTMDDTIHLHWKGGAERILAMCSSFYDGSRMEKDLDEDERKNIKQIIQGMGASGLSCIAFAHKQLYAKSCAEAIEKGEYNIKIQMGSLTLLGLVGIIELCRPGVYCAVQAFRDAGVDIKMITGDNSFTAKAVAKECGILRPEDDASDEAIVTGADFRNYSIEKRLEEVEKIRVMARSSSSDKLLIVQSLKENGRVVAFIGDGMNDALALKEANIGVSMGIQGVEVAKENSDIVIHSDNFAYVADVLRWGRCIYDNIQKFIQLKLTANVAALLINFVAAISSRDVPLTAIQLLWVNLIVDTLGAFALSTDLSTEQTREVMKKPPVDRTEPLITNVMWRNLVGQAIYQMAVLLTLQFKGESIFSVDEAVKRTMIFNAFVLCQVFNKFNARKLAKMNIFKGIHKDKLFLGIIFMTVVLQVVMIEFLKQFAVTKRLSWGQWVACFGIAAASWPIAWVVKCIPVPRTPILQLVKKIMQRE